METNTGTAGATAPETRQAETHADDSQARRLMQRGRERVRSTVDDGKSRVARSLTTVAHSLKDSGRQLRETDDPTVGTYVERVADQLDRAAGYLDRSDVDSLVDGVERFARRNPALFIGAAFAVGVLGARFLKSSRSHLAPDGVSADGHGAFGDREIPTTPVGSADMAARLE
jgi:hypothetical protein